MNQKSIGPHQFPITREACEAGLAALAQVNSQAAARLTWEDIRAAALAAFGDAAPRESPPSTNPIGRAR